MEKCCVSRLRFASSDVFPTCVDVA
ncbi:hypothetical protein CBM2587_A20160 [Cupriavidus taiwanensis]|uniref:Uncharacterized protein n=1 Tax=Cupriavidus taiwanensis TaxID=164546 RepID=A0A975WZG6_9BURK|nr:hypothetical protein CBM2587_A20160 [Cupriavidus taiwanensis]